MSKFQIQPGSRNKAKKKSSLQAHPVMQSFSAPLGEPLLVFNLKTGTAAHVVRRQVVVHRGDVVASPSVLEPYGQDSEYPFYDLRILCKIPLKRVTSGRFAGNLVLRKLPPGLRHGIMTFAGHGDLSTAAATDDAAPRDVSTADLLASSPIRILDAQRSKLRQRSVDAVLNGTEWLTAPQVAELADIPGDGARIAEKWVGEHRIFAIQRGDQFYYPAYLFDMMGAPIPVVGQILQVFSGSTNTRIASWFESRSAALDGRRPRELLATAGDLVLDAARAHVVGPMHG